MAIGAKLAAPERPVLALAGDGGVLFTMQELATARDLGLPLPLVVWNNHGYGEIRDSMASTGIPPLGTDASATRLRAHRRGFRLPRRQAPQRSTTSSTLVSDRAARPTARP